ncbi:MAG TPA: DUF2946 family protein [Stellaceae bacterium]|nr:DUF2946 family protein [Stellaceae bacterium]
MRARQWRGTIWAARLGLIALALNALVPIHIAFDLAEALGPSHQRCAHAEFGGAERQLLALLVGHREAGDKSDEHGKHHRCPVCSALGALTGLAAPAPTVLALPVSTGLPATPPVTQSESVGTPSAYQSRAPPVA